MRNLIETQEIVDKKEKEEILKWSIASLFFQPYIKEKGKKIVIDDKSANVIEKIKEALYEDIKIEIIIARKRVCIIKGSSVLISSLDKEEKFKIEQPFCLFVNEGNLFEVAGEELKNGILKIDDLKGKIISRIFSAGDIIFSHAQFSSIFGINLIGVERIDNNRHDSKEAVIREGMIGAPRCIVSGLPWERADKIHPVSVIKLTPMIDIFGLYKKDAFIGRWMGLAYGSLLEEEFDLSQLRLWSQLTNRGKAKVAFILYNCFKGEMPIQWWKNLQGKELGEKDVDNPPYLLKKPKEMIIAFAIEGKQLALLSGLDEKNLEDLLMWADREEGKGRNRFLEDSEILTEFLGLTVKQGVYFFFIREKSPQKLNQKLLYKIHSKVLQELKRYFFP